MWCKKKGSVDQIEKMVVRKRAATFARPDSAELELPGGLGSSDQKYRELERRYEQTLSENSKLKEWVLFLKGKILLLEDYALNVDHHRLPPPPELSYLVQTEHGDCSFAKDDRCSSDRYSGDLIEGRPSGRGKFVWACGDVFEGQFVNGKMHGRGLFRKAGLDGYSREETRYCGAVEGLATATHSDGRVVQGCYVAGKAEGVFKTSYTGSTKVEFTEYSDGKPEGLELTYDRDKKQVLVCENSNGKRTSCKIYYFVC